MTNKFSASVNVDWKLGLTNNIIIVKCQEIEYFSRQFAMRLTILRQNLPEMYIFFQVLAKSAPIQLLKHNKNENIRYLYDGSIYSSLDSGYGFLLPGNRVECPLIFVFRY